MRSKMSWIDSLTQLLFASGAMADVFAGFEMPHGISDPTIVNSAGGKAVCLAGIIPVTVTATNTKIVVPAPTNELQTTQVFIDMQQAGSHYSTVAVSGGPNVVSGTYGIYSRLCFPNNLTAVENLQTVQFLTHGATLDYTYWDTAPGYSYVDAAASAGYATFLYDRLGTGLSEHPDPLQVVQAQIQVDIAHELVQRLRNASLKGQKFKHLVGVGHSAGSALSQGITAQFPADFDALILTGTSTSLASLNAATASFATELANTDPSGRFSGLADGYFSQGAVKQAVQFAFWRYPNFDPKILEQQFLNRHTNTLGELLTLGSVFIPSTAFTGPVDVVDGENDFVFCGGDCNYGGNQAQLVIDVFYPAASKTGSQTYLQPGSGHVIAQHLNAWLGYGQMISFLQSNGIH